MHGTFSQCRSLLSLRNCLCTTRVVRTVQKGGSDERHYLSGGVGGCGVGDSVLPGTALMSSMGERLGVRWRAIIAGAVVASGVSFTLHAFAAGIGLSVMSSAPTW